jgi:hypothetical protein
MIEELLRSITFEYAGTGDVSGPAGEPDAGPPPF